MKFFSRKKKKNDVIDLAMDNLKKNGVRKEDTLEYAIDKGRITWKTPLTDEERESLRKNQIHRYSYATHNELIRIFIKESLKDYADFLGDEYKNFEKFTIAQYNQGKGTRITLKELESNFNLPPKKTREVYASVRRKATHLANCTIDKEKGARYFYLFSPYNDKYDGQDIPIDDFEKYIPFMLENKASPIFIKDKRQ